MSENKQIEQVLYESLSTIGAEKTVSLVCQFLLKVAAENDGNRKEAVQEAIKQFQLDIKDVTVNGLSYTDEMLGSVEVTLYSAPNKCTYH